MQMERREVEVEVELFDPSNELILVVRLVNPAMEVRCKFNVLDLAFCCSPVFEFEICNVPVL